MVDNKVSLVVMVAYLDAPLVIKNILEVLEVLVDLNRLLFDLMANEKKLCSPPEAYFHANSPILFPLEFVVWI